jgi:fatty acid desaturase
MNVMVASMTTPAPIDHREAIAAISPAEMAELRELIDRPGLIHLTGHVLALAATSSLILIAHSPWILVPALTVQGALLIFLFTLEHECIHGTAFRSTAINVALAEVAGFLILLPPRYFRYFHLAHHRFTQDPDNDPELATPKPSTWAGYLLALTGWGYWTGMARAFLRYAIGRDIDGFVPERAHAKVVIEARAYVIAYAALAGLGTGLAWTWLLWLWIVPLIVGQPFLRAYLMAEHTGLPLVPDMLLNSRTVFATPVIQWLAWNMPNHTAHHAVPTVPFHHLPQLTRILARHLRATSPSYAAVHREIASRLQAS